MFLGLMGISISDLMISDISKKIDPMMILIGDITHENEEYCKGFGSMMMEALISYAEENGHTYIFGNLSEIDKDHADRLHHFYEKFGFSITIYDESQEMYYGKIEKWICQ